VEHASRCESYQKDTHDKKLKCKTNCLKLTNSIYGLIIAGTLGLRYKPNQADPILFVRNHEKGRRSFLIVYVNDGGIFSSSGEIKELLAALGKNFIVKDQTMGIWKHVRDVISLNIKS
jgi:hypothetical protein